MTTDREYQIENLKRIFADMSFSPVFKDNKKYPANGVCRIAYDDIRNYKYIIRIDNDEFASNRLWSEETEILVEYKNIESLVDDGWRLD